MVSNSTRLYRRITHVIRHILTANVQQRAREVAISHLQTVVDRPQCRSKAVADTGEATARSRVRLEHHELLPKLLGNARRVEVRLHHLDARGMGEVVREDGLGVLDVAEPSAGELGGTVLVGIAEEHKFLSDDGRTQ